MHCFCNKYIRAFFLCRECLKYKFWIIRVSKMFMHPSFLYYPRQSRVHCSFIEEPFWKTLLMQLANSPILIKSPLHALLPYAE
jgi:hypothetical protein